MDIIIHGAAGRMGRLMAEKAAAGERGAAVAALVDAAATSGECFRSLSDYDGPADLAVDFSNHAATGALLDYCLRRRLPVVIATTGHTEEELARIGAAAAQIPIFCSANMSLGVAVLADLAKRAAAAFPTADIEIVEIHHNQKLDVPSGTALMLGQAIREVRPGAVLLVGRHENGKRSAREIGIHSLRLGNEVGVHEIHISTGSETLCLRHQAVSRALFADGALAAAEFLLGKAPGLYSMRDMLI